MTQLETLQKLVSEFSNVRDWTQFHTLKDLSIGLSTESNELLQIFRFKNEEECLAVLKANPEKIEDELADVFYYLLRIADLYGLDLEKGLRHKMIQNEAKYPVHKVKGKNLKYDEYDQGE
jgi:NTP pyrophosphatase (non-canonical NTP hydrolase)